jgi:ABC-2 type transport system ATP-binding protein
MCDRVAIIDQGKILLTGTTMELRAKLHAKQVFRLRMVGNLDRAMSLVQSMNFVESVTADVDSLIITINNPYENSSTLLRCLLSHEIDVIEYAEEETTLEDVYLNVIKGGSQ